MPQIIDARVKTDIPQRRSLFRPKISANLPNGKIKTAIDNIKDNTTQLSKTVFIANSLPIEGKAILTDDTIKGTINAPRVATNNTIRAMIMKGLQKPKGTKILLAPEGELINIATKTIKCLNK